MSGRAAQRVLGRFLIPALAAVGAEAFAKPDRSGAPPEREGRVVRVDRPRRADAAGVRGCLSFTMDPKEFTCFGGEAPEAGELFRVIDTKGQLGMARVKESSPSVHDQCGLGVAHDVELEYQGAPPRNPAGKALSIPVAVSGIDANPARVRALGNHASLRPPSGRQGESVWIALDRDGDRAADFMATAHQDCREAASRAPRAPAGKTVHALCLDYWEREGAEWKRTSRDVFYNCSSR